MIFAIVAFCLLAVSQTAAELSSNHTVTHEAWIEVEIRDLDGPGEDFRGKFTVALFGETVPMTVLNFASLVSGHKIKSQKFSYKGTHIHRIVKDFVVQMGDVVKGDGSGSISIYGERFNDENFILSHRSAGWVAMANHGTDTNGSQFYILLTKARWMDGKHVVFGKVIRGFDVVKTIGEIDTDARAVPKKRVKIIDCGVKQLKTPYELKPNQLDLETDLPAAAAEEKKPAAEKEKK
jgi:cyclophilin family peptidyl-prolyl cis-trans isomerase